LRFAERLLPLSKVPKAIKNMPITEDAVRQQLKKVIDPELFVNIEDLGLVYVVKIGDPDEQQKQAVAIDMTLTSPMCPAGPQLVAESRQFVSELDGVSEVEVRVVMDPPWSPERMTDDARDQLGIF
jgi:metal-sulfur cluster biosynthetic enzyme